VQVQKLQAVEEKRMVPYVVQKPVTRLVENKVPVTQVQWIQEQHVRPVTTQRESFKMETVVEEVPVRTTTMERVVQKVKVPVKVARRVEVKETRMVPRQVATRIPLDYYDPFTPISSASIPSLPSVVQPAASLSPRPSDSGWKESASGTAGNGNAGASSSTNSGAGESSRSSAPLPDPKTESPASGAADPKRPTVDASRPLELAPSPSGVQLRESTAPNP
jgi:hypothetical protein